MGEGGRPVVEITAIGREKVLADDGYESTWVFDCREWEKVKP